MNPAGFPCGSAGKESACNAGDMGSIPGLGRSPGEGKGYPLQYSGLENSLDCIVHGVAKSRTQLSDFQFHFLSMNPVDGPAGDPVPPLPQGKMSPGREITRAERQRGARSTCRQGIRDRRRERLDGGVKEEKVDVEVTCSLTDEWVKMWCIYTMEDYSAMKKNDIMSFVAIWTDLEMIMLSEVRQRQMYDITYMWSLKNRTDGLLYKAAADSQV